MGRVAGACVCGEDRVPGGLHAEASADHAGRLLRAARLADRPAKLAGRFPPRVRAKELWRVAPEYLEPAQDDATLLAIRAQERAGLDIITDGGMRRESYSNRFATALEGVDIDNPGTRSTARPSQSGAARHRQVRRRHRSRCATCIPPRQHGPAYQERCPALHHVAAGAERFLFDGGDGARLRGAVNAEIKDLFAAAPTWQIDEPYMQARPRRAGMA